PRGESPLRDHGAAPPPVDPAVTLPPAASPVPAAAPLPPPDAKPPAAPILPAASTPPVDSLQPPVGTPAADLLALLLARGLSPRVAHRAQVYQQQMSRKTGRPVSILEVLSAALEAFSPKRTRRTPTSSAS